MKSLKEMLLDYPQDLVFEMSIPLKKFKDKVDGQRFQLVENWCLCKYCSLYDENNYNYNHWLKELNACIKNLKNVDIKNNIDKSKTLVNMLINDYDYNQTQMIIRIIKEKFEIENITVDLIYIANEFVQDINRLIEVISHNDISINNYLKTTFNLN